MLAVYCASASGIDAQLFTSSQLGSSACNEASTTKNDAAQACSYASATVLSVCPVSTHILNPDAENILCPGGTCKIETCCVKRAACTTSAYRMVEWRTDLGESLTAQACTGLHATQQGASAACDKTAVHLGNVCPMETHTLRENAHNLKCAGALCGEADTNHCCQHNGENRGNVQGVQGRKHIQAPPDGSDAPAPASAHGYSCGTSDYKLSDGMLNAFSSELVPVSGGSTLFTGLEGPKSARVKCDGKPPGGNARFKPAGSRCVTFYEEFKLRPYGGKVQATSATDMWKRGYKCKTGLTGDEIRAMSSGLSTAQLIYGCHTVAPNALGTLRNQLNIDWLLLHYNAATQTKTAVKGIAVKQMLDFAMVETEDPKRVRAYILNSTNLLVYGVDTETLQATQLWSKTIQLFSSSVLMAPTCCIDGVYSGGRFTANASTIIKAMPNPYRIAEAATNAAKRIAKENATQPTANATAVAYAAAGNRDGSGARYSVPMYPQSVTWPASYNSLCNYSIVKKYGRATSPTGYWEKTLAAGKAAGAAVLTREGCSTNTTCVKEATKAAGDVARKVAQETNAPGGAEAEFTAYKGPKLPATWCFAGSTFIGGGGGTGPGVGLLAVAFWPWSFCVGLFSLVWGFLRWYAALGFLC